MNIAVLKQSRRARLFFPMALILLAGLTAFVTYALIDHRSPDTTPVFTQPVQTSGSQSAEVRGPNVTVSSVVEGLDHPWDVAFLPSGTMIVTERGGTLSKVVSGKRSIVDAPYDVSAQGEGGLLGLVLDPAYPYVYMCYNSTARGGEVRVVRWNIDTAAAISGRKEIVTGIPANPSGRHSGCRIAFGPDGNLWIGTGDAADASNPQNPSSLGGKILRVTRDGLGVPGNLTSPFDSRIYSYDHRNTQGLAFYEGEQDGSFGINVEHGPDKNDEVNPLKPGNFGWAPTGAYDESVPMTDAEKFADAVSAIWSSGESGTIAPAGAAFLRGEAWGEWQGRLAVSVLKGQQLMILNIQNGKLSGGAASIVKDQGRLRAAVMGPDGSLYVTTDNGGRADKVLKITPSAN